MEIYWAVLPQVLTSMKAESMGTTTDHLTMAMNEILKTRVSPGRRDSIDGLFLTGGETLNGDWEGIKPVIGNSLLVMNLIHRKFETSL